MTDPTALYFQVDQQGWERVPGRCDGIDAFAAQQAAEYYHNECAGWEAQWPITIDLMLPGVDAVNIERYRVDLEHEPSFIARAIE